MSVTVSHHLILARALRATSLSSLCPLSWQCQLSKHFFRHVSTYPSDFTLCLIVYIKKITSRKLRILVSPTFSITYPRIRYNLIIFSCNIYFLPIPKFTPLETHHVCSYFERSETVGVLYVSGNVEDYFYKVKFCFIGRLFMCNKKEITWSLKRCHPFKEED